MLTTTKRQRKTHGCPTGKRRFRDHRAAVSFLHHAQNARGAAHIDGASTKLRVVRCYECHACRGYHVTSQPASTTPGSPGNEGLA